MNERRFWLAVDANDCWDWLGYVDPYGYGNYGQGPERRAHRIAWILLVGSIPDEMCLDHLCRVKTCVNPDHMEIVTWEENLRRANVIRSDVFGVCSHPKTPANIYRRSRGYRGCRPCHTAHTRAYRERMRA